MRQFKNTHRTAMRTVYFLYLMVALTTPGQADESLRWYAGKSNSPASGTTESFELGKSARRISLLTGWICDVGETSSSNAKKTSCVKGTDAVEFSVQCDSVRPNDRTQVRFRSKKNLDFIEVGCETLGKQR